MQQAELNRAVARATGETITTIKELGFSFTEMPEQHEPADTPTGPLVMDWDAYDAQRPEDLGGSITHEPLAA